MLYIRTIMDLFKIDMSSASTVFNMMSYYDNFDFSESTERQFKASAKRCFKMYQENGNPFAKA